jgi:hypothetical protein
MTATRTAPIPPTQWEGGPAKPVGGSVRQTLSPTPAELSSTHD